MMKTCKASGLGIGLKALAPITAANLVFWGVLLTVFYDVATCAVYIYVFKADIFKTLIYVP